MRRIGVAERITSTKPKNIGADSVDVNSKHGFTTFFAYVGVHERYN